MWYRAAVTPANYHSAVARLSHVISGTFDPSFATLFRAVLTIQRDSVVKTSIALAATLTRTERGRRDLSARRPSSAPRPPPCPASVWRLPGPKTPVPLTTPSSHAGSDGGVVDGQLPQQPASQGSLAAGDQSASMPPARHGPTAGHPRVLLPDTVTASVSTGLHRFTQSPERHPRRVHRLRCDPRLGQPPLVPAPGKRAPSPYSPFSRAPPISPNSYDQPAKHAHARGSGSAPFTAPPTAPRARACTPVRRRANREQARNQNARSQRRADEVLAAG